VAAPAIQHPKLQRLYDYWAAKCGARKMPARADIDPIDMAFIVGNVIMADVIPGSPLGFRIRLHGTTLSERVGYDLTGKMLDDMPVPEFRELSRRSFTKVATTGEPLHALADRLVDDRMQHYEAIVLPLWSDGTAVDRLLVGLIYDWRR
jgi:hypothetical protein